MRFVFFFLLMLALLPPSPAVAADSVLLATGEWAPYTSRDIAGQGFITRIVKRVFEDMGMKPKVRFYPWKRCYKEALEGRTLAAFPYTPTEKRSKEMLFSDSIAKSETVFFIYGADSEITYETLEDLRGLRIGGIDGYFYREAFEKADLNVSYVPDEFSALRMLKVGRVDVVPVNRHVGNQIIATRFPPTDASGFRALDKAYSSDELCLVMSRKRPEAAALMQRFNQGLRKLEADGFVREILREYGVE